MIQPTFAAALKAERERLQLTQREAAERLGIPGQRPERTWQNWESIQRTPPTWAQALILKEIASWK